MGILFITRWESQLKISIAMAVYNKAPYLPESIESVLSQSLEDFELICVDSGSTDESLAILHDYALKDHRVKVYSTPYTAIPAATKNFGIDQSKGEYVFNLDADDYLSADALEKMYARAKETSAQAVIPDLQTISVRREALEPFISGLKGDRSILLTNRQAVTESLDWTIHAFALWDGDLVRKLRLEEFGAYSDEFSARLLFFNCRSVAFSEGTYFHRINSQSVTGKISLQTYDRPEAIYRLASFLEEHFFDEENINSLHFSIFKDCCFLINVMNRLALSEISGAERKIKAVFSKIDMRRVRKSVFEPKLGRAALWKVEGKVGKYVFALLTFLNWGLLRKFPLKLLF